MANMESSERMELVNALAVQAKTDPSAIPELWTLIERLVQVVCRRYCSPDKSEGLYEYSDLCQCSYFGFLDAIKSYDPERGAFSSVLIYHVRKSCRAEIGLRGKRDTLFDAGSLDEPISQDGNGDTLRIDLTPDPGAELPFESVEDQIYNAQLHAALDKCMAAISQHHADLLRARYYDAAPLETLASVRGISGEGVRQNIEKALDSMRRPENAARLEEYRQHIIDGSIKLGGLRRFKETGYSSVAWAAEALVLKGVWY